MIERGRVAKEKAEPEPLVKEPKETRVWTCSDNTTKRSVQEAKQHEVKLAFEKLVQPYDMSGRRAEQPIPLPSGMRDRDDLWRWIQDHGHKIFPWFGVYAATFVPPIEGHAIKAQEIVEP